MVGGLKAVLRIVYSNKKSIFERFCEEKLPPATFHKWQNVDARGILLQG